MTITGVVVRRRVVDLDDALPFYEQLTGEPGRRLSFGGAELAAVAPRAGKPNGRRTVLRHPDGGVFEYVGP